MNADPLAGPPQRCREIPVGDSVREDAAQEINPGPPEVLSRLALWLADVSAEADLAQKSAESGDPPVHPADAGSTAVEATR